MRFMIPQIRMYSEMLLIVLEGFKIDSIDALIDHMGEKIDFREKGFVYFDKKDHKSVGGVGVSYFAGYAINGYGNPLEFRINDIVGHALVLLKSPEIIPGYRQVMTGELGEDKFGNIRQSKENLMAGFPWVKKELERLASLGH